MCLLAVVIGILHVSSASTAAIRVSNYARCPRGKVSSGSDLGVTTARSGLDCARRCSQLTGCAGVNVCPSGLSSQVSCTLISDREPDGCGSLVTASASCFYVQKTDPAVETETSTTQPDTTTPLVCQNGGTLSGSSCVCPIQYSGTACQRLIRDCQEMFENGHTSSSLTGIYTIQPITLGATTVVMNREDASFNQDWATLKAGIPVTIEPEDFFIGLENLHHFLLQAEYELALHVDGRPVSGSARYQNFTVGPESTRYEITYGGYAPGPDPADDGFGTATPPLVFHSSDDSPSGCSTLNGGANWYGAGCTGDGRIFGSEKKWPME
ncbi:hypothetical protein BaRGS_00003707, partial [Batillaria attramentaria]